MDQTTTGARPRSAPGNAGDRYRALEIWWGGLTECGRGAARGALNGEDIPGSLFLQLADAGVLAVSQEFRGSVRFGGPTFPMPADISAYITTAADPARRPVCLPGLDTPVIIPVR